MADDPAGSFLDAIGGPAVATALAYAFYDRVLADPLLLPLFRDPREPHAERMAWWLIELFGGERIHTDRRGGFPTMVGAHRGLGISEEQRATWVRHMMAAADAIGLDTAAQRGIADYIEPASRFAMAGSVRQG